MRPTALIHALRWSCFLPGLAFADIVTDGSVGPVQALTGPAYTIGADLGTQAGQNLFHSFSHFSLTEGESATFTAPATTVSNVIARVTGGTPSRIDGTLRSTIPGAALWFINPAGVMFGTHANLDVPAAFHVGTANELRSLDGTRVSATAPEISTLSSAPIESFGFSTATPAAITVDGATLRVPDGQDFSIAGGDITLHNSNVWAFGGTITLESMGRLSITRDVFSTHLTRPDGDVFGDLDSSGVAGGIIVRASHWDMLNAYITSDTYDNSAGLGIRALVTHRISLTDSSVTADVFGNGRGGQIRIEADELSMNSMAGNAIISSDTYAEGNAGDIFIDAGAITMTSIDGAVYVSSDTYAQGDAGYINVQADRIHAHNAKGVFFAGFSSDTYAGDDSLLAWQHGNGGVIELNVADSILLEGAAIQSLSETNGNGGDVRVTAGTIALRGMNSDGYFSTETFLSGRGGDIDIQTGTLLIESGQGAAYVSADTYGRGDAGNIRIVADAVDIRVSDDEFFSGISSDSYFDANRAAIDHYGDAGNIDLIVREQLNMYGGSIQSYTDKNGAGGNITVYAGNILMDGTTSEATIDVSAYESGTAGFINLTAERLVVYASSIIATSASSGGSITIKTEHLWMDNQAGISASVTGDDNSEGGNVTLLTDTLVAIGESSIKANATQGRGGRIVVDTGAFIHEAGDTNVLDASSGSDVSERQGRVELQSDVDVGHDIGMHDTGEVTPAATDSACQEGRGTRRATLARAGMGGLPADNRPEGMTGSFAVPASAAHSGESALISKWNARTHPSPGNCLM